LGRSNLADIGQLFCAGLSWKDFGSEAEVVAYLDRAVEMGLGGLILFGGDLEVTPRLLKDLQGRIEKPFLIMADIETGTAQQISGGTRFPGMMALGAARSPELAYRVGKATALEAREIGINVVLAPVLDVNTNPRNPIVNVRSFGDSPELVAELGAAYIRGCQDAGAVATAKHFPGHGDTDVDSHSALPVIHRGPGSLREIELPPFKAAIDEGVMSVMVGHIALPNVTGGKTLPASISEEIITGLLREEMGFRGLVMTDAMIMEGVGKRSEEKKSVIRALQAGADMLLYCHDVPGSIKAVESALGDGELSGDIVEGAIRRVTETRRFVASFSGTPDSPQNMIGCREHKELSKEVAESAATLVRNRNQFFPIANDEKGAFVIYEDEDEMRDEMDLPRALREIYPEWELVSIGAGNKDLTEEQVLSLREAQKVVVFVFSPIRAWRGVADLTDDGIKILNIILGVAKKATVVSMGSPYLMRLFPRIDGYLCLYSPSIASQETAIRVLNGDLTPRGRLPVSIPSLYPFGWCLPDEPAGYRP
jgi:beta-N-acetylhexosaminidase